MKRAMMWLALSGILSVGAACGGDDMVSDAKKLVDEMCACKDAECLAKVEAKGDEMKKKYSDQKPSEDQMKELMAIAGKATECEARIKGAAGGDAPAGEAAPQ